MPPASHRFCASRDRTQCRLALVQSRALQCRVMTGPLRTLTALIFGTLLLSAPLPGMAQRPVAPDAGCVEHKGEYTCNWSSFQLILERAHTIAPQTGHIDRTAQTQLITLISKLGKNIAPEGATPDLTFAVRPVDPRGVDFGPMDHDVATLKIYAPSTSSAQGTLVWAEVYRGQGDRPWPAQVNALLEQFQARMHGR